MDMEKERQLLVKYGRKLVEAGLTKGTGGNLSVFDRASGRVAITPSGIDFFEIQPEDIVIMDLDGHVLEGNRVPSSEWAMHVMPYKYREDIDAVVHAHTMYATILSCLREDLPATHYMIAVAGENVRVAEYATFGTMELAKNAFTAMKDRKAVILANHGLLAGAKDLANSFNIIEEVEYCAEIYTKARSIGNPVILPEEEMKVMLEKFKSYGQRKGEDK